MDFAKKKIAKFVLRRKIKEFLATLILVFILSGNIFAESRDKNDKLNELFEQLKKNNNVSIVFEIEMKIWNIWSRHPTDENLTKLLANGSVLMSEGKLEAAYKIFSAIIESEPDWAEGWNKRATVLYLMGRYQDSLKDIDEVLQRENRHFGALSGQGLVQTKLENYEKAIKSYQAAQKIYPSIKAAKIMIPQLEELIKGSAI